MTLHHLEVLCATCRENSMSGAAKRLHLTQPAVSRTIMEIEKHYGFKVFERINKRLFLTEHGRQLWNDSERVLKDFGVLEQNAQNSSKISSLQIGCGIAIGTILMPELIMSFHERYPNCRIHVLETSSRVIQQQVISNDLDFALIEGPVSEQNLHGDPFCHDRLIPVCAYDHLHHYYHGTPIRFEELVKTDLLLPAGGYGTRELLERMARENNLTIAPAWSSSSHQNLLHRAIRGNGVAVLSQLLVRESISKRLLAEIPAEFQLKRRFSIVWHRNKQLPTESLYFIQLCHQLDRL